MIGEARSHGRRRTATALAVLLLTAALASCGFKTEPRPFEHTAPVVPGTPTAKIDGDGSVVVRWDRATESVDGKKLTDLAAFHLERLHDDGGYRVVAEVSVTDADRIRRQATFRATDSAPIDGTATYRVRAVNADGQIGPPTPTVIIEAP